MTPPDSQATSGPPDALLASAVARLDSTTNWEQRPRRRMRPSLDPIRDLLARLGGPPATAKVVHVAGSKGKGSVAALVDAGLRAAGLCTGRYGSPHVERMNERVVVDGRDVADAVLARALHAALDAREAAIAARTAAREATWFDLVTAAALRIFADEALPWIVVEVGLGGRLDSTNVLDGEVCVVTSIELEHTAVLGDTVEQIAAEKAGILHPGCALVSGLPASSAAGRVIDARAAELGVRTYRPRELAEGAGRRSLEALNRGLAGAVLEVLGERGHRDARGAPLGAGLLDDAVCAAARLPGRCERFLAAGVPVVLDGAHTPQSVGRVLADLCGRADLPGRPVVVLGLAAEKDLPGILKTLQGAADRVICTSVGGALHRAPEEIARACAGAGLEAETATSPRDALQRALITTHRGTWVLIVGSLYLAGVLRPLLAHPSRDLPC